MNVMQEQLLEWFTKFGVDIKNSPDIPDADTKKLRIRLIEEEVGELITAINEDNLVEVADGIADSLYVLIGCAVAYGLDIEPLFNEVHRSNMTKLWPDGTVHRNEHGKVIKPPQFSRPNLSSIIERLQND